MNFILIFTILYGLLPLLIYHFLKEKLMGIKAIYPFLVVVFIASLYEFIGSIVLRISAENWYLIYKTLAFFSIHYLFFVLLDNRYKIIFSVLILIYLVMIFLTFTYWKTYFYLNISAFFNVFQTIIILFFSILWFKKVFQDLVVDNLLKEPFFYFLSGLIICYTGSVFIYLMGNSIYLTDKTNFQYYWLINIFLNLILRTLLIVGILKARVKNSR